MGFVPDALVLAEEANKLFYDGFQALGGAKTFKTDHVAEVQSAFGTVLDWTGQGPALSFLSPTTLALEVGVMKFDNFSRKWLGLSSGVNDKFCRTTLPTAWPGTSEISAGALTANKCWDFDVDPGGNVLVIVDLLDFTIACTAAGTWTKVSGAMGHDPQKPNVVYEPVAALWCAAFKDSANLRVLTSSNRGVSWTDSTPPTFAASAYVTLGTNKTGRIVLQGFVGTNGYFSYSDDGGVTWSAAETVALGFTATVPTLYCAKPQWNGSYWLAKFNNASSTLVLRSTDGTSWTVVATLTATPINSFACIGELWAALTTTGEVLVSTDAGATWRFADTKLSSAYAIYANHARFIATAGSFCWVGPGAGSGGAVAT